MVELHENGLSYGSIGKMFNVSRQRVHQITAGYQFILKRTQSKGSGCKRPNNYITEVRALVFNRDKNTCQMCSSEGNVLIHHLDKDDMNNELTNLVTLCTKCHLKLHRPNHPKSVRDTIKRIPLIKRSNMEAEEIKELRKRLGLTQLELARRLKVAVSSLKKWEHGNNRPSGKSIKKLNRQAKRNGGG